MYAAPSTVIGGMPRASRVGLRGSGILHPTLLKGMASSIGANTFTNTGITRTTNIVTPGMVGTTGIAGMSTIAGVTNVGGVIGQIPGESRIEYVPYQKTVIEYEPVERTQYVPYERKVIEYEDRKRIQQVPVERSYTDYYTIEYITEYYPQVIPETKIDYVPVERVENRIEYYPVERQVVHYPDEMISGSRKIGGAMGSVIPTGGMVSTSQGIGLSRVASVGTLGTGLAHHTSRFGSGLPVSRPTSSYATNSISNGLAPSGGYISGGYVNGGSFGMNGATSYGIGPQTIVQETTTTTVGTPAPSGRYLSPNGATYVTSTTSPSITEIKSSEPRIISR